MFRFEEKKNYSMPAHFGGMEWKPGVFTTYHDVSFMMVDYETDRGMLEQYIPDVFELKEPVVNVSFFMNRGVDWMAGGRYNMVSVGAPVTFGSGEEKLTGFYSLVVWENKATPCFPGREVTGIPKIFADIEDFYQLEGRMFSRASYEGTSFLEMGVRKKRKLTEEETGAANLVMKPGTLNWFGWRYIPNIGKPGAALSHATVFPQDIVFRELYEAEGTIKWRAAAWEENPTQAHIIRALSRLPVRSYRGCTISIGGTTVLRDDLARQLE